MLLGEEKHHPVIVLKDVSIKYLLLILEYVYCGRVDLEQKDLESFKKVAESLQIKVEFNLPPPESEPKTLTEMMSQDTLSSTIVDHEMHTDLSWESDMESDFDLMQTSGVAPLTIDSLIDSEQKLNNRRSLNLRKIKSKYEPALKKIKIDHEPRQSLSSVIKRRTEVKMNIPTRVPVPHIDLKDSICVYCDHNIREKDRNYHQKFCWKNPSRVESNCNLCHRKYEYPAVLKRHMQKAHLDQTINSK